MPEPQKRPRGRPPTAQREKEIAESERDEERMAARVPFSNIENARERLGLAMGSRIEELEKLPAEEAAERHKRKKYALAELVLADAVSDLEAGTEDTVSPMTGEVSSKRMTQKSKFDNARRIELAVNLQDVALGMPSKLTARMDDVSVTLRTEIREVVEVRPSNAEIQNYEAETLKAIMPPDEDLIEGEVE